MIIDKSLEQLTQEEIQRQALEAAAKKLEEQTFKGEGYRKALKAAARVVRSLKP